MTIEGIGLLLPVGYNCRTSLIPSSMRVFAVVVVVVVEDSPSARFVTIEEIDMKATHSVPFS